MKKKKDNKLLWMVVMILVIAMMVNSVSDIYRVQVDNQQNEIINTLTNATSEIITIDYAQTKAIMTIHDRLLTVETEE